MYTLARENPLAAVLCPQFQDFYCATCFAELDVNGEAEILMCDDCSEVSYCSLKCQRKDWRSVHQVRELNTAIQFLEISTYLTFLQFSVRMRNSEDSKQSDTDDYDDASVYSNSSRYTSQFGTISKFQWSNY